MKKISQKWLLAIVGLVLFATILMWMAHYHFTQDLVLTEVNLFLGFVVSLAILYFTAKQVEDQCIIPFLSIAVIVPIWVATGTPNSYTLGFLTMILVTIVVLVLLFWFARDKKAKQEA